MAATQAANPQPAPSVLAQFETLKAAVNEALAANNLPAAILGFEQLLVIDPRNPGILSNLAKLHVRSGALERALSCFAEAHAAAPAAAGIKQK